MNNLKSKIETLYAKSNPSETIRQHTDNLLSQAKLLKDMGYVKEEKLYEDLLISCEYHDYGKVNDKFQKRITTHKNMTKEEVPHNVLSAFFINEDECNEYLNVLFTVLYHHYHKVSPLNYINLNSDLVMEETEKIIENDDFEDFFEEREMTLTADVAEILGQKTQEKKNLILLKGFLHKCDYSASAGIDCEIKNDFLNKTMVRWKTDLNSQGKDINELQKFCLANSNKNIIVTAPTGMGKTEAGLLWCGDNKCFFVLPLRTAINAMYERLKENLFTDYKEQVALLHSDMKSYYLPNNDDEQGIDFDYINRSKQLSMPITICTPDQIFNFVLKYPGYEHKLATASYSKFIIDEIQMYTPELLSAVIYGIRLMKEMGGKIAVLTATLPPFVRRELKKIYGNDFVEADFSDYGIVRHNMKTFEKEMTAEDIFSEIDNIQSNSVKKFLVVCNSIDIADKIYSELREHYQDEFEINLFHAHFIKKDRKEKEDYLSLLHKRNQKEIWVATSVVEASLDVDFDVLFTELSDLFSLFQRMGRVNRKGEKSFYKTNCYVYTELQGNAKRFNFFDEDIYDLSKQAILNSQGGVIDEKQKKDLIETYLSADNVRKTQYLKTYSNTLTYYERLKEYTETDLSKFRKILSYDVIPENIYHENLATLKKAKEILSKEYQLSDEEKSGLSESEIKRKLSEKKLVARTTIDSFTLPVSLYRINNYKNRNLSDDRAGIVVISNCRYDKVNGLAFDKLEKKVAEKPDDDSCDNVW